MNEQLSLEQALLVADAHQSIAEPASVALQVLATAVRELLAANTELLRAGVSLVDERTAAEHEVTQLKRDLQATAAIALERGDKLSHLRRILGDG